jgi:hypothetical protein
MTGRAPPPGGGANAPTSGGVATRTDTGSGAKQPNLVVVGGSGPQRAQNVAAKPGTGTTGIVPDVHLQTRLNELQTRQAQLVQELLKQRGTVASKNKTLTDLNDQNISTTDPKILQAKKRLADEQRKLSQVEGRLRDVKNDINRVNWELASGAKPWRQMPLDSEARIGLHAELEAGVRLIEKGWEPIGKTTLNPDLIRLPADYHKALREYQGRQGIDGVYRRVRNGRVEYLIVESKGTLDASARAPSGKGKLETTANGDQLSRNWTTNNLKRSGLDSADRADLEKAMGEGRARSVYAQTTKKGTSFFNVDAVSDTEVKIGDPFDP